MIIVFDPGSKNAGFSLWSTEGKLIDCYALESKAINWGSRLWELRVQIMDYFVLANYDPSEVTFFAIEEVQNRMLKLVGGAFLSCFPNAAFIEKKSLIPVTSWKAFIRKFTGEKDPKGKESLKLYLQNRKDVELNESWTEDICDSVMMGFYLFSKGEGYFENRRSRSKITSR